MVQFDERILMLLCPKEPPAHEPLAPQAGQQGSDA
jgi:hypothetical protein